jgi:membrane protease YdiL (CAAX protease family)
MRLPRLAAVPAAPAAAHVLLAELAVVFLVTLGLSSVSAGIDLAYTLNGISRADSTFIFIVVIPGQTLLSVALGELYLLVHVAGCVGLVVYVVHRSGEGVRSLGLSLDQKRPDLMLLVPYIVIGLGLLRLGALLPLAGGATGPSGPVPVPAPYAVTAVLRSLEAGLVEEFVVLAFVVTRLRQIGVHPLAIIAISAVLRASYHLEYGPAAVGPLLFGVGMAAIYLVTRRLLPAIAVHAGYDLAVSLRVFSFF